MSAAPDVVIVGGGIIGSASAYMLALEGVRAQVVEQHRVGAHASGGSAGLLALHAEHMDAGYFERLGRAGRALYPAYAERLREETGIDVEFQQQGLITLIEPGEVAAARALADESPDLQWLDPAEMRELEPQLRYGWAGGLFAPGDGQVNTGRLTRALAEGAARRGARFQEGIAVTGLIEERGHVHGVRTTGGEIGARSVVIASGPWSGLVGAAIGQPIPVYPVKGQLVWARTRPLALNRPIYAPGVYLAPKYELGIAIGSTEEHAGFDERPTLGGVAGLIAAAVDACPILADAELAQVWASVRPGSADGLPILGPVPDRPGLILATGHFRNGVLLSLITGQLAANWVLERPQPIDVTPFSPARFMAGYAA